jgi:hypothetical protein
MGSFARLGLSFLLVAGALGASAFVGCDKVSEPKKEETTAATKRSASERLKGTWEVESFVANDPSTAASVAAFNLELVKNPGLAAIRTTYDGARVRISAGNNGVSPVNPYKVVEDTPDRCVLDSAGDKVAIDFRDDNHMTIDRKGTPFGAKMNMRRALGPAPAVPSDVHVGPEVKLVMRPSAQPSSPAPLPSTGAAAPAGSR